MRIARTRVAQEQISRALRWWRQNRPAARELLRDELRLAYRLLQEHPLAGAPIEQLNIRRLLLERTRYYLFYVADAEQIIIVELRHQSRREEG